MYKTVKEYCDYINDDKLLREWDYEKNTLSPDEVNCRSNTKIHWKCVDCGYEWSEIITNRTHSHFPTSCPKCSHILQPDGTSRYDLVARCPSLLKDWDYKKNKFGPENYTLSSKEQVYWICPSCNKSYKSTIFGKAIGLGVFCPKCSKAIQDKTSRAEQILFYYISQIFSDAINRDTHIEKLLDIYIPSKNIAVMYDGMCWVNRVVKNNKDVDKSCQDENIKVYRVCDKGMQKYQTTDNVTFFYRTAKDDIEFSFVIKRLLEELKPGNNTNVNIIRDMPEIIEKLKVFTKQ